MKKVNAGWLQVKKEPVYSTLEKLIEKNMYVGFTGCNGRKYMLVHVYQGIYAVCPNAYYNTHQEDADGTYFIFESEKELLTWMMKE